MDKYTEMYFKFNKGYIDENEIDKCNSICQYLKDAGISEKNIRKFIINTNSLKPEDLPEWLWEGSLLKKNKFYYHRILHVVSPPPSYNLKSKSYKSYKFYYEMKIMFTIQDMIKYFYDKTRVPMLDYKRDKGSMEYLLSQFSRIDIVDSVDFVLKLIDIGAEKPIKPFRILALSKYDEEAYNLLLAQTEMARATKANKIVWRM